MRFTNLHFAAGFKCILQEDPKHEQTPLKMKIIIHAT